ncbi:hypothetical protein A2415_03465 [candidate division WWE3 bacterium RIFOXYC1_FULL_39_7]|uniref:HIT domain-containing protein n=2 Tax=Katanobacteria TaxID=422282 RepID=A0A1F4X9M0_UNCKA|nr:MAG: hypothetical protein A2415_03465 [candidate division WWE3 bacterium RIFOXYC1_FULL_39_7]OGC78364.1 MAG: hypothetical protein A2619_05050 [candidate division WWE3 bacterium RIFOXYD1_FULL_39_9]
MNDCIFCKITNGEIESSKFWENEGFIAILDLFPNTPGASIVISKKHYESDYLNLDDPILQDLIVAVKSAAEKLKKGLKVDRVAATIEGTGVNHLHMRLFPLHSNPDKKMGEAKETVFNEQYQGYITTHVGPMASREDLDRLVEVIRGSLL